MEYEFVLSAGGKRIAAEKGNMELERIVKRVDSIVVNQKK